MTDRPPPAIGGHGLNQSAPLDTIPRYPIVNTVTHGITLPMPYILLLRWDAWKVPHIARLQVAPTEVEEVCHGTPMFSDTYLERLRVLGPTNTGRMLTVILAHEGDLIYYVITARRASRRERRRYQGVLEDTTP